MEQALRFCQRTGLPRLTVTTRTARRTVREGGVTMAFVPASLYCFSVGRNLVRGPVDEDQLDLDLGS